ncbi:MAG: homocysteine S-methyltransferase family protein [Kiritimatiellae bacterium]|nr:homocysteine S-methyltransferase family protein [Kiritimatiellia bacterium]
MDGICFLDGGFGTELQARGLPPGADPSDWNLERPEAVSAVHADYVGAGSQVVLANTFGATRLKYRGGHDLGELVAAAVRNARAAGPGRVALDVGPTGKLLKPVGDLDFDAACEAFAEEIRFGAAAGADLVFVETMGDLYELKAAVLAAKENCSLPVWATVALQENGTVLTGGDVEAFAALAEGLGVDALGFNCGLGPDLMLPFVERLARATRLPIVVKPNAGLPKLVGGKTVFTVGPEEFADHVARLVDAGARVVGGCCGTTPAHLAAVRGNLGGAAPARPPLPARATVVSSGSRALAFPPPAAFPGAEPVLIGERINPTGKKKLREALKAGDVAYVLREAVAQQDAGARVLDVNVGVPGLDEPSALVRTVEAVQSVTPLPLQIDTSDPVALDRALRRYNGKALVNSVNGKRESMDAVFPAVKKYGGVMVALALDEAGIPKTAEGRLAIAAKILAEGRKFGFGPEDFIVDVLCMAVSADGSAGRVALDALKLVREKLGVHTVLGVSNVSFGLPDRPLLNAAMLSLAAGAGLSAAIFNPSAPRANADPAARAALLGEDANCLRWIGRATPPASAPAPASQSAAVPEAALFDAIRRGLKLDAASAATARLASGATPLDVIDRAIVPALEDVGRGFETGKLYLPQLLMAAEAASAAFASVRRAMASAAIRANAEPPIVIATVKGDVHDIGKNIVRALLENYGHPVVDLGRDVPPEEVVAAAKRTGAKLVGLSALMTTTVGAMAETVRLLHERCPGVKTFVGGAVVTAEYAREIGADFYTKDAMASVRLAAAENG